MVRCNDPAAAASCGAALAGGSDRAPSALACAVVPCSTTLATSRLRPGENCTLAVLYGDSSSRLEQQQEQEQRAAGGGSGYGPPRPRFKASVFASQHSPVLQALQQCSSGRQQWYAVPLTTLATAGRAFSAIQTMMHRSVHCSQLLQEVLQGWPGDSCSIAAAPPPSPVASWPGSSAPLHRGHVRGYCRLHGLDSSQQAQVAQVLQELEAGPKVDGRAAGPAWTSAAAACCRRGGAAAAVGLPRLQPAG